MKRDTVTAYRRRTKATEASVDHAVATIKAERDAAYAAIKAAPKPAPVDPATIPGARAVKTSLGWFKVVRVNAKTVSVETGQSWTDRIAFGKIIEVAK